MTSPEMVTMPLEELRQLAAEMQRGAATGFDPATVRKATVTATSLNATPPVITVQLSGDTTTTIPGVRVMKSYLPTVGDQALILKQGRDLLAVGAVASASYATGTKYARYSRSTTFTCAHNVIEKVEFTASDITDSNIITTSNLQDFVTVRTGTYLISADLPWAAAVAGSRWAVIGASGSPSTRWASQEANPSNGSAVPMSITKPYYFAAGAGISIYAYQDSGSSLTLFPSTTTGPLTVHFKFLD